MKLIFALFLICTSAAPFSADAGFFSRASDDATPTLTQDAIARSKRYWEYLKSIPYEYTDRYVNNRIVIRGLPSRENNVQPRVLTPESIARTVFRHYSTREGIAMIRASHSLIAGKTAYVNSPYVYTDLTGVFLTDENFAPNRVGLDAKEQAAFVDVMIDPHLTVIRIEPGIYLIPGPSGTPDWMKTAVKNAAPGTPYYPERLRLDRIGYDPLVVPVAVQ